MPNGMPPDKDARPAPARQKMERRRHPRAITDFSATLVCGGREWAAKVINLSLGGALLDLGKAAADAPIAVKERLSVTIRSRGGGGPVTLTGAAVMWNRSVGPQPLLAIQFDQVADDDADMLDDLLEEALTEIRGRNHPARM